MATIKLTSTGRTINLPDDEDQKKISGKQVLTSTGRVIDTTPVTRINTKDFSTMQERVPQLPKVTAGVPQQKDNTLGRAQAALARTKAPQLGIGFGPSTLKQPEQKAPNAFLPKYDQKQVLKKAQEIGQRAADKTEEQTDVTLGQRLGVLPKVNNIIAKAGAAIDALGNLAIKGAQEREAARANAPQIGTKEYLDYQNEQLKKGPLKSGLLDKLVVKVAEEAGIDPTQYSPATLEFLKDEQEARETLLGGLEGPQKTAAELAIALGDVFQNKLIEGTTGIPYKAVMATTSGTEEAQRKLSEGKDAATAGMYGAGSGGISALVESLGGIGGGIAGTTAGQKIMKILPEKTATALFKLADNALVRMGVSAGSEAFEEAAEYVAQWVWESIVDGEVKPFDLEELKQNVKIGGLAGGTFEGINLAVNGKTSLNPEDYIANEDYRVNRGENEAAARMAGQLDAVYGANKLEGKAVLGKERKNIDEKPLEKTKENIYSIDRGDLNGRTENPNEQRLDPRRSSNDNFGSGLQGRSGTVQSGRTDRPADSIRDQGLSDVKPETRKILADNGITDFGLRVNENHQAFSDALALAKTENPNGASVDAKTVEELQGSIVFMDENGTAGGAVKPDGDIVAVFKNSARNKGKNAGVAVTIEAIAHGGKKLDCYGNFLVNQYAKAGMVPVARVEYAYGINPEMDEYVRKQIQTGRIPKEPDVYFMMLPQGTDADTAAQNIASKKYKQYTERQLKELPLMDYDAAAEYRDNLIKQQGTTGVIGGFVMPEKKRPASLRQRVALQSVPDMEDRANSAKAAIDSGASDDVVKMLQTEDDGMVLATQSDLGDVAGQIEGSEASTFMDLSRMLDAVAGKNKELRQRLYDAVEKPLINAKAEYARNIIDRLKTYKADMDRLGIKVGSKESAAVQWYGEKQRQTGVDGETIPYSLEQLQREFPDNWQNIVEAEKIHRQIYDEFVERINAALSLIYPDVEAKAAEELGIAKAEMDNALWELAIQERLVQELEARATTLTTQMRSNNLVEASRARQELLRLNQDIEAEKKHAVKLSEDAKKAAENHAKLETEINSGEYFRGKRLIPRKDYFHHFVEMEEVGTIKGLRNMLNRPSDIDPSLVGVSEFTKPKSKFAGWLQRRTGAAYTEDAVAGMARYIPMAEYKINIEPYIAQMRGMVKSVVDGTKESRNANGFIDYMTQFTNDLAGKSHKIDRAFQSEKRRKTMKVVEWLNNRAAANAVVGNLGSAIVQISNIPNATTYVSNPMHWAKAAATMANRGQANALLAQSPFLAERYITNTTDLFSKKTPVRKFAEGMMEVGDREASKLIWLAAYNQYEANGGKVKGSRQYENAADYADDITRRSVGGRGVGEMPPLLKSKVIKMVAPFQVEVNNSFNVLKEQMGEKNAAGLLSYCISAWAINSLIEQVTGRRVVFDPIQAIVEAIKTARGDEEEEGNILSAFARLGGEVISAIPIASAVLPLFFDTDDMEKIFGEQNPTRYGTGMLATSPIGGVLASITTGKVPDLTDIATTYLTPYGGAQIERGVKAAQAFGVLPAMTQNKDGVKLERREVPGSYNNAGQLRFAMEPSAKNIATTAAFGEYATPEGRAYLEGNTILSADKTDVIERGKKEAQISPTVAESVIRGMAKQQTSAAKRKYLYDSKLTTEQKAWMEHELLASATQKEKAELALTRGIPLKTFYWIEANNGNGGNKETEAAINKALGLNRSQKEWLWSTLTGGADKNNPYK